MSALRSTLSLVKLINLQDSGEIRAANNNQALALANEAIQATFAAIPESERHHFKSNIRYDRSLPGYIWSVVLK